MRPPGIIRVHFDDHPTTGISVADGTARPPYLSVENVSQLVQEATSTRWRPRTRSRQLDEILPDGPLAIQAPPMVEVLYAPAAASDGLEVRMTVTWKFAPTADAKARGGQGRWITKPIDFQIEALAK